MCVVVLRTFNYCQELECVDMDSTIKLLRMNDKPEIKDHQRSVRFQFVLKTSLHC